MFESTDKLKSYLDLYRLENGSLSAAICDWIWLEIRGVGA
jgi:hypothetical protein